MASPVLRKFTQQLEQKRPGQSNRGNPNPASWKPSPKATGLIRNGIKITAVLKGVWCRRLSAQFNVWINCVAIIVSALREADREESTPIKGRACYTHSHDTLIPTERSICTPRFTERRDCHAPVNMSCCKEDMAWWSAWLMTMLVLHVVNMWSPLPSRAGLDFGPLNTHQVTQLS